MTKDGDIKGFKRNETNGIAGREAAVLEGECTQFQTSPFHYLKCQV